MADDGVTPGDWVNMVRRLRLDGVVPGVRKDKFLKGTTVKAVAYAFASYADYTDGTNARPGVSRLALDCEISYDVAARCVAGLRGLGIIAVVRQGTSEDKADEYRLTPLEEWPDSIEVPTPAAYDLMVRRLTQANRGKRRAPASGRGTSTVDSASVPLRPAGAPESPTTAKCRGTDARAPAFGSTVPLPEAGATEPRTETPSLTETTEDQLRTDVTVVGRPQGDLGGGLQGGGCANDLPSWSHTEPGRGKPGVGRAITTVTYNPTGWYTAGGRNDDGTYSRMAHCNSVFWLSRGSRCEEVVTFRISTRHRNTEHVHYLCAHHLAVSPRNYDRVAQALIPKELARNGNAAPEGVTA